MRRLVALAAAGLALLLLGVCLVAASSAQAFTGEGSVVDPGPPVDLTGPAKTILTKPTFLTDNMGEAGAFGGTEEASGVATVFEGAGILPALGGVIAFGVGTVVGSEICNVLGIEGCWYFHSDGADPAVSGGEWVFVSSTAYGIGYQYYWSNGGIKRLNWSGVEGVAKDCGVSPPSSFQFVASPSASVGCHSEATHQVYLGRWAMSNRSIDFHATDDPGIGNYAYTPPSNWSENLAKECQGSSDESVTGRFCQHLAHETDPETKNPYANVEVPDCDGLKVDACVSLAEELDLKPKVTELDWEDAVIEELDRLEPEKTREEEAERVITVVPSPGEFVVKGDELDIESNPKEEDMPEFVPEPGEGDGEGEDSDEYKKRLPFIFIPNEGTLSDGTLNPEVGPDKLGRVNPAPGTRVNPHTEHELKLWNN